MTTSPRATAPTPTGLNFQPTPTHNLCMAQSATQNLGSTPTTENPRSTSLSLAAHDERDEATQQAAFNALSTASWYVAQGQPAKALARMRRAKSHITAMMEATTTTTAIAGA